MTEKKFKHTIHFKKKDIEYNKFVSWSPSLSDWRDVIEDYLYVSKQRRENKFAMFKLQMDLIVDVMMVTDGIKGYIDVLENPEKRKKEFPNVEIMEDTIKYWEGEIFRNKLILNALKDIGDGIAWRVFDYQRFLIYNMCVNNDDNGPLILNQGFIVFSAQN